MQGCDTGSVVIVAMLSMGVGSIFPGRRPLAAESGLEPFDKLTIIAPSAAGGSDVPRLQ